MGEKTFLTSCTVFYWKWFSVIMLHFSVASKKTKKKANIHLCWGQNPGYSTLCGFCGYFPTIPLGIVHWNPEYIFANLPWNIRQSAHSSISLGKQNAPAPLLNMRGMEWLLNHQLWRGLICFNESHTLQLCVFQWSSTRAELQFVAHLLALQEDLGIGTCRLQWPQFQNVQAQGKSLKAASSAHPAGNLI